MVDWDYEQSLCAYGDLPGQWKREKPMSKAAKWHGRWIKVAELIASWSPDRSTKVGAVVIQDKDILAWGYNGFPKGLEPEERHHERPAKYGYTEHE